MLGGIMTHMRLEKQRDSQDLLRSLETQRYHQSNKRKVYVF